jgi:outer membrane receptor protein involved in Fe transport
MRKPVSRTGLGGALLATTALGWAMPAMAQSGAEDAANSTEIIVTAQRRSESLQKVPVSIQALGEATLDNRNVASFDDYAKLLPSVGYQSFGPGQSSLSFRGINSGADGLDAGPPPTTGTYLDEIPISTIAFTPDLHVYDIARVEALSGPQGTLFGASSLSGTMRLITNKPDPTKFEGGYDLSLNKFGKGDMGGSVEAFVNVPISDNAAIRLVGFYDKQGGYIDNIPGTRRFHLDNATENPDNLVGPETIFFDDDNADLVKDDFNTAESYGGRAALKVDLDEDWSVMPQFIYQKLDTKGSFLYDPTKGDLKVTDFLASYNNDQWWQAALTIEGKIGNWDLVYSGGYMKRRVVNEVDYSYYTVAYDSYYYTSDGVKYYPGATYFPDADGNPINPTQRQFLNYNYRKHTQELRLSSPSENPFRVTVGAFYQRQTNDIDAQYIINGLNDVDFSHPDTLWFDSFGQIPGAPADIADVEFLKRLKRVDKDYALFAEGSYQLSEQLTATAGIRVFWVDNSLFGFSGFHPWDTIQPPPRCLPVTNFKPYIPCANVINRTAADARPNATKESGETHKINLSWQVDPGKMIYATYSTGYRPGGVNRKEAAGPYKSDRLSNFEIGWKTSWANGTVRWNGAVFYEKWDDMIFTLARPGDNGVNSLANVGGAKSVGIESDIILRLGQLEITGSGAYINAELTEDFIEADSSGNQTVVAPKGTRLPVQPKFKSTLAARYNYTLGSSDAFFQATMNSQSGTRTFLLIRDNNGAGNTTGFTTFDFSAGIKLGDVSIEAFIENAFDKRGVLTRNTACGPSYCGIYARNYPIKPQFFGIKMGQRF